MSSFRKSVEGATKIKLAPPKAKYIENILSATRTGEHGVAEVFRVLQQRIRDPTWTVTFKALIVVHLMVKEGEPNVTLAFLSTSPRTYLSVDEYAEVQTQGRNIRHYSTYLMYRAKSFQKSKTDYVRTGAGHMRRLTVDKGLLRETEIVQEQIAALLKCDLVSEEPENDITLCALRLLVMDLLALFPVMNEGAINVLEHFFELSKPDAERALSIYKRFAVQTDSVVRYLTVAKRFNSSTRLDIPKLDHAPLSLAASLEEYLNDMDFDTNRRQFLAEREAKTSGKSIPTRTESKQTSSAGQTAKSGATINSTVGASKAETAGKRPGADLMDFFDSIEPQQTAQPAPNQGFAHASTFPAYGQQNGFASQAGFQQPMQTGQYGAMPSSNPFGQIQPQPTGAGFGGYGPQPYGDQPQYSQQTQQQIPMTTGYGQQAPDALQPQQTNPFRQSAGQVSVGFPSPQPNTNSYSPSMNGGQQAFSAEPQQQFHAQPMMPQPTGTNPFMQRQSQNQPPQMMPQPTGTNPFMQQPQQQQQPLPMQPQQTGYNPFNQQPQPQPQPMPPQQTGYNPFAQPQSQQQQQQQQPPQLMPQATGTNPFARGPTSPAQPSEVPIGALVSQATGSTNPFKQAAFVNQQTGQGWQNGPQGTMGGLEQLPTVPVFPRPGGQAQGGAWYQ